MMVGSTLLDSFAAEVTVLRRWLQDQPVDMDPAPLDDLLRRYRSERGLPDPARR